MPQDDLGTQIQELVKAVQETGRNTQEDRRQLNQKLDDLSRKQDQFPTMINDMRREVTLSMDTLRRDFERLFVPRAEYDPKHEIILQKIREYDELIKSGRAAQDEYYRYRAKTDQNTADIAELTAHKAGWSGRVIAIVSLTFSAISVLVYIATFIILYSQHVTIK